MLACLLWPAAQSLAQSNPDPGVLLEQTRRVAPAPPLPQGAEAVSLVFTGFGQVRGLEPSQEQVLREVEKRYLGRAVNPQRVLDMIARELEDAGVTVVLQVDAEGTVTALRPVLARIDIQDGRARPRARLDQVLSYDLEAPAPLKRRQLERNATLLNEAYGIKASYQMLPGEQPGQTRLLATLDDGEALDGFVSVDNAGNRQLGNLQTTAGLNLNNRLGWAERLSAVGLRLDHGEILQLASDVLLHRSGLRGGLSYSRLTYDFAAANTFAYKGEAIATGLQFTLPLVRNEFERSNLMLSVDRKRNKSWANAQPLSDWAVDAVALAWQGQRALPASMTVSYTVSANVGKATQRDSQSAARDEPFLRQGGDFGKTVFRLDLNKTLLPGGLNMGLAASGQIASKNLPGSEKFQLGGISAMRGRDPQLVGGDHALHLELRLDQPLNQWLRVGGFIETAWLKANADRITAVAYQANTADEVRMTDAGLRLMASTESASLELTLARPVQGTPRYMNGAAIATSSGDSHPWVAYLRANYRF